jgi:4-hydroxy-tetrahydrodipicolinate reductase
MTRPNSEPYTLTPNPEPGRRLLALACKDADVDLVQAIEYAEHPLQGKLVREVEPEADSDVPLTSQLMPGAEVVIDFSSPAGTTVIAKRAEELGIALVIGISHFSQGPGVRVEV